MPEELTFAVGSLTSHGARLLPKEPSEADALILESGLWSSPKSPTFFPALEELILRIGPAVYLNESPPLVISVGGTPTQQTMQLVARQLVESGNRELRVAVIRGANIAHRIEELHASGSQLWNHRSETPLEDCPQPIVNGVCELGAEPIARALAQGAHIVIGEVFELAEMVAGAAAAVTNQPPPLCGQLAELEEWLNRLERLPCKIHPGSPDLATEGLTFVRISNPLPVPRESTAAAAQVKLVCNTGFKGIAVVRFGKPNSGQTMHQTVASFVAAFGKCLIDQGLDPDTTVYTPPSRTEETKFALVPISVTHGEEAFVQAAMRRLQQLDAIIPGPNSPKLMQPPVVTPEFTLWPTSIPTSSVEVNVDIRPAKAWVEG